ncbi:hypothetical protein [Streptomyces acidiscabies]|uniref:hypothetical protein n=1 Tax=Streptomyces acidiscabies TaxID=42234 RepID=UPI0009629FC9|nr:hypothetical protein [Streptomyces acidiscabies]GAV40718.1 hypothetical protein Saa2_03613 [Streptomyces acidiscabies]
MAALYRLGLALALWGLVCPSPATGRRRKLSAPNRISVACGNVNDYGGLLAVPNLAWNRSRVRPYWMAREQALRWKRRRMLVMAAHFRFDLDTLGTHAVPAGGEVR